MDYELDYDDDVPRFWFSSRFGMAVLGFLGFLSMSALRRCMDVAMVCMVNQTALEEIAIRSGGAAHSRMIRQDNMTECASVPEFLVYNSSAFSYLEDGEFVWDESKQNLFSDTFFWGYVIGQIPSGLLANRYGGKRVFGGFILASSASSLLIPMGSRTHYFVLLLLRFIGGVGASAAFPAMHTIWGKWAPPMERSKLASITYAGALTGTLLLYPTKHLMCEYGFDNGWPSIFYTIGGFGVAWVILWVMLASETPVEHYRISREERRYILLTLQGQNNVKPGRVVTIPWTSLFTSLPFLTLIVCHFSYEWIVHIYYSTALDYVVEILQLDIMRNDLYSNSPYLGLWLLAMVSGSCADRLRERDVLSTTATRKIMQLVGALIPSGMAVVVGFLDCTQWKGAVSTLIVGLSFCGFQYSGFLVSHLDIAPMYAGIMMAIANCIGSLASFVIPFVVDFITVDKTHEQWQTFFFISASICMFGTLCFIVCGSGELQPWAADTSEITSQSSDYDSDLHASSVNQRSMGIPIVTSGTLQREISTISEKAATTTPKPIDIKLQMQDSKPTSPINGKNSSELEHKKLDSTSPDTKVPPMEPQRTPTEVDSPVSPVIASLPKINPPPALVRSDTASWGNRERPASSDSSYHRFSGYESSSDSLRGYESLSESNV